MTREEYAKRLLDEIGAPSSDRNLEVMLSWMQAEGGSAKWNPLNTTLDRRGATNYNSVGVKNYVSAGQGVEATAYTLNYGADRKLYGYDRIRDALRRNFRPRRTLRRVEASEWGTGGLAKRVLADVKRDYPTYANKEVAGS